MEKFSVKEIVNKLDAIEFKEYIPYAQKVVLCNNIINASCINDNGVNIDSCKKYILYTYAIIDNYTNIEMDSNHIMEDYDILKENDIIDYIYSNIKPDEIKEFNFVLSMSYDDFIENNCSTRVYVSDKLQNLNTIVESVMNPILEKISDIDINSIINKDDE